MKRPGLTLNEVGIEIAGRQLTQAELTSVEQIRVRQQLSQPALCEITFNQIAKNSLISQLVAGLGLVIRVDPSGEFLFSGEITALEYEYAINGEQRLRVRGYDRLHRLRKRQTIRGWENLSLVNLARELTGDLGISVAEIPQELKWQRVIQHQQSDLELLAERAEAGGIYFSLNTSNLELFTLAGFGDPVPLAFGESLFSAEVEINGEQSCETVSLEGWNPWRAESHSGSTSQARTSRDVMARIDPHWLSSKTDRSLPGRIVEDGHHAEAFAQAELDWRVAREVAFRGTAEGNRNLRPGQTFVASGLAGALNGRYVITESTHLFGTDHGYITEFSTYPPSLKRTAGNSHASVVLGMVTRVEDPDRLGRVQASLPSFDSVETGWMQVLAPGAGSKKGLMMLPDVGDQIVILCLGNDPSHGIVLGGLYGAAGPLDSGLEGTAIKRYSFITSGGQKFQLDDAGKAIRLQNSNGSYLELGPERAALHSKARIEIEAPGQAVIIRGKSVDFQKA